MKDVKVLASYRGTVKGLRPYLLSLMYANVVPFEHKKKTASAKAATGREICKITTLSIPDGAA